MTIKVKDNDKIVFEKGEEKNQAELLKALNEAKEGWKQHDVFANMSTDQIVEYLRGKDCDV